MSESEARNTQPNQRRLTLAGFAFEAVAVTPSAWCNHWFGVGSFAKGVRSGAGDFDSRRGGEMMSTRYEIIWPAFCLTHRRKSIGDFFVAIESSLSSFLLPHRTSAGDVPGSNRLVADALRPPPVAGEVAIDRICLIDE